MKLSDYKVGDRVKVPHGTGEIVGFESFYTEGPNRGREAPMTNEPNSTGVRALIRLDPDHRWACGKKWPEILYGAWAQNMELLPESDLTNQST